jgi:hypothetical protein
LRIFGGIEDYAAVSEEQLSRASTIAIPEMVYSYRSRLHEGKRVTLTSRKTSGRESSRSPHTVEPAYLDLPGSILSIQVRDSHI